MRAPGAAGASRRTSRIRRPPVEAAVSAETQGDGASSSGKTRVFGTRIRRFESSRPSHSGAAPGMKTELKVFSGNANPALARSICEYLRVPLGQLKLSRFSDGEVYCQVLENVRGTDVFLIQPLCSPVNENLMELLIVVDALKRSSAARITAVLPYYGYARQDRKDKPRVPISAKLVADLLQAAGVQRLLTMDLHAPAIQGFFDVPVDHLYAAPILLEWMEMQRFENVTIVSP